MSIDLKLSRRALPAPMLDRSSYSIFSVIKQSIGKDLTKLSIPVVWNEPLSFLQRLAESLEYSSLIDRAVGAKSTVDRFQLLTAFVVSNLGTHLERMSKPFNPLLGETYELKMQGDAPFHYISEQVSHHPPVSALFVRGENWTLTANVEPKVKFQGTHVVAVSEGRWILRIKKQSAITRCTSESSFQSFNDDDESTNQNDDSSIDEDEYTWKTPSVLVHNILFGRLWCEFQGSIEIKHTQSDAHAVLTIKSHSWFASQATKTADMFKYSGFIFDGLEKIGAFQGNYGHCHYAVDSIDDTPLKNSPRCSIGGENCVHLSSNSFHSPPCDLILTPSSRLIWHRSMPLYNESELAARHQYYFFTPFAMCLNEQIPDAILPPTDCRFRQDIRFLEEGHMEAASDEKHRLEEKQRAEAKERVKEYQPLWFEKNEHGEYIYNGHYDHREFKNCPNLFYQSSS